jgi:hypothetical protein
LGHTQTDTNQNNTQPQAPSWEEHFHCAAVFHIRESEPFSTSPEIQQIDENDRRMIS